MKFSQAINLSVLVAVTGRSLVASQDTITSVATCEYDSSNASDESCSFAALEATGDQRFEVYPGGESRCGRATVDGKENPYFFQVDVGRNGMENNVILAFQGGGAFLGFDSGDSGGRSVPSVFTDGIFDLGNEENPFHDWTRVLVTYCTGDFHIGQGFDVDENGEEYVFNGLKNSLTVFDWVKENIPNPDNVFLYGSSAGSNGVQFWSNQILSYYKTMPKPPILSVTMDSSTGLSRDGDAIIEIGVELWKICSPTLGLTPEEIDLCESGLFASREFQMKSQARHRDVPFAYLNYKFDSVLYDAYCQVESPCSVTPSDFYFLQKEFLKGFIQETNNNVLTFWVNESGHVMAKNNGLYSIVEGIALKDFVANVATHEDGNPAILQSDCVEIDVPEGIDFDVTCDPDLLGASFVSSGAGNGNPTTSPPSVPEPPCPCSCADGTGVILTRPSVGQVQCVPVDQAALALDRLPGVACLFQCP